VEASFLLTDLDHGTQIWSFLLPLFGPVELVKFGLFCPALSG
jgi:hypothetical protein